MNVEKNTGKVGTLQCFLQHGRSGSFPDSVADRIFGSLCFVVDLCDYELSAVGIDDPAAFLQSKMVQIKPAFGLLQFEDGKLTILIEASFAVPVLNLPVSAMGLDNEILDNSFHK